MVKKHKHDKKQLAIPPLFIYLFVILLLLFIYTRSNKYLDKDEYIEETTQVTKNIKPTSAIQLTPTLKPTQQNTPTTKKTSSFSDLVNKVITLNEIITPTITSEPTTSSLEWGVSKQIDEYEWTIRVGEDEKMATPKEIHEALNVYRKRHGSGELTWEDSLVSYAQTRAEEFISLGKLDQHKGFREYVENEENRRKLGFWGVGENASYGSRLMGVHLIEWIFAGDEPHDKNQLNPDWTHVGIGVKDTAVDIIFGKWKM